MPQLNTILKSIFSRFFAIGGRVVETLNFDFFLNRDSLYLATQAVSQFGSEWMKITHILFVYIIFSSKRSLKTFFLTKKGVKIQNFK